MVIKLKASDPAVKRAIKWFNGIFEEASDETFERVFNCKLVAEHDEYFLKFIQECDHTWFMLQWAHPIYHVVSPLLVMKQAIAGCRTDNESKG